MARRKGTTGKQHLDKEKERHLRDAMEAMRTAIDCGNEEDFVKLLKQSKPEITREELVSLVNEFRTIRHNRRPSL